MVHIPEMNSIVNFILEPKTWALKVITVHSLCIQKSFQRQYSGAFDKYPAVVPSGMVESHFYLKRKMVIVHHVQVQVNGILSITGAQSNVNVRPNDF